MMALGVLLALRKLGLRVPADVSFAGIDDFAFAELLHPPPTVVRVPVAEMAERAIEHLLEEIATKRPPSGVRQVYQPTLVIRESCRSVG